ncbi:uncharacterized protein clmnb isoform X2 [Betta splendens]|nr:uncharacterized protein clmnb isoform X2 [Betta splendens]
MALLEELSGCKLLYRFRSPSHHIFRLNNISKALAFLDDRHVKLLGIDASGIADGSPPAVLNLVWNIILYFQVKKATGGLQRHLSSSLSSLSMSSYPSSGDLSPQQNGAGNYSCYTLPSKGKRAARESKYHGKAIKTLLQWVQRCTSKFGVEVHDFGKSWRSGLAFLAVIKSINPGLVDLRASLSREPRDNVERAFALAHQHLDIPRLLEPEDVTCSSPDEQSIITYVSMFLGQCPDINEDYTTTFTVRDSPHFGSLDSLTLGGTTACEPRAGARKRWAGTSSGSTTSLQTNGCHTSGVCSSYDDVFSPCYSPTGRSPSLSPLNRNKGPVRSAVQPPSLLPSPMWVDQRYIRQKDDEFSLSSEDGTDSLSALDSDEEDAYTYILDLNKEICQSHNPLKRQVARVEEETTEELNEESEDPDACAMLNVNGWKQREDTDANSEARAHSEFRRKFVVDKEESSFRDMTDSGAAFDLEPNEEGGGKEPPEDENAVRVQGNGDYSEEEETARAGVVTYGHGGTAARGDEAEKTKMLKMPRWQKEAEGDGNKWLVNETVAGGDEEEMDLTWDEGKNIRLDPKEEEKNSRDEDGGTVQGDTFGKGVNDTVDESGHEVGFSFTAGVNMEVDGDRALRVEDVTKSSRNDETEVRTSGDFEADVTVAKTNDEPESGKCKFTVKKATVIKHPGGRTPPSLSSGSGPLQCLAALGAVTPSELETLLVLWILLYCCLMLSQMNP